MAPTTRSSTKSTQRARNTTYREPFNLRALPGRYDRSEEQSVDDTALEIRPEESISNQPPNDRFDEDEGFEEGPELKPVEYYYTGVCTELLRLADNINEKLPNGTRLKNSDLEDLKIATFNVINEYQRDAKRVLRAQRARAEQIRAVLDDTETESSAEIKRLKAKVDALETDIEYKEWDIIDGAAIKHEFTPLASRNCVQEPRFAANSRAAL
ncbi:hypothetical protein BDV96DRAFT_181412 [Lophiotrema nucula]|uniref:Uncharacterized protein n=1 Tax=Lophiotrema nucula TaxID=690887 RepID=A0A6A5YXM4_9PLEO|nr:hypothetical protein BDV96DRAFT_181412 [Lophiotrema nucula]